MKKNLKKLKDNFNRKYAYSLTAIAVVGVIYSYFVAYSDPQPMFISQHIWRVAIGVAIIAGCFFGGGSFFSRDMWS